MAGLSEIPPDKSVYGTFHRLRDEAEAQLRVIVENAATQAGQAEPGSEAQKVGDLYASFMDEEAIERLGTAPIATDLALVEEITDRAGLIHAFGVLERSGSGSPFGYFVNNDAMASDRYVMYLTQAASACPTSRTTARKPSPRSAPSSSVTSPGCWS